MARSGHKAKLIAELVATWCESPLLALGFHKRGALLFWRRREGLTHFVEYMPRRGGTAEESAFTVAFGVQVDLLSTHYGSPPLRQADSAHWHQRIGFMLPVDNDFWWDVTRTSIPEIGAEQVALLGAVIEPTLAPVKTVSDFAALCRKPGFVPTPLSIRFLNAAIIERANGDGAQAEEDARLAMKAAQGQPSQRTVTQELEKLGYVPAGTLSKTSETPVPYVVVDLGDS